MNSPPVRPVDERARVAIDLGAESCRVSLLRWRDGCATVDLIHRFPNGPVHRGSSLHWPLNAILAGLDEGLCKAAQAAPEGIASIAVDGWAVDYVRLGANGQPLGDPFCYRDERTIPAKQIADASIPPEDLFRRTGAQPLRINTLYQLLADAASGIDIHAPWLCLPEYVLHWLGGRRVAEYTNATHTGLVDLDTGDWSRELFDSLEIPIEAAPQIVPAGTIVGRLQGPLAAFNAFRETQLIAPACHDTASAIAGIPVSLDSAAYICCGTWSLVGTLIQNPDHPPRGNAGALYQPGRGLGRILLPHQREWHVAGEAMHGQLGHRGPPLDNRRPSPGSGRCTDMPGIIDVDAEPLLLDGNMPARINDELRLRGFAPIPDVAGNEPVFARVIFESLAGRYATALTHLEQMLGRKLDRIHVLGGGSRNKLLLALTAERTGLPVEAGESGKLHDRQFRRAVGRRETNGKPLTADAIRHWAAQLCPK